MTGHIWNCCSEYGPLEGVLAILAPDDFSTSTLALTLLFIVFYSALHILTWAMSRYRLPEDAVLLIFAAVAIAKLVERANVRELTHQC